MIEKVKDISTRRWHMEQMRANGWSRNILALQIDARAHTRHGKAVSNFAALLPAPQSDRAQQTLKDPYIFDFLTLTEPFEEKMKRLIATLREQQTEAANAAIAANLKELGFSG